ncbi:hypothetical protein D3C87_2037560 [compost metagenome]
MRTPREMGVSSLTAKMEKVMALVSRKLAALKVGESGSSKNLESGLALRYFLVAGSYWK